MSKKAKYYVVWNGKEPGVYTTWEECQKQVVGIPEALYKSFPSEAEAQKAFAGCPSDYFQASHPTSKALPQVFLLQLLPASPPPRRCPPRHPVATGCRIRPTGVTTLCSPCLPRSPHKPGRSMQLVRATLARWNTEVLTWQREQWCFTTVPYTAPTTLANFWPLSTPLPYSSSKAKY